MCRDLTHKIDAVKPDRAETDRFHAKELPLLPARERLNDPPGLSSVGVGSNWTRAQVDPNRRQCFALEPTAEVASSRRNSAS